MINKALCHSDNRVFCRYKIHVKKLTSFFIAYPMVLISDSCSFFRRNFKALRAEFLIKPISDIFHHCPLRITNKPLVCGIRTTDSLKVHFRSITNITKPSTARSYLLLGSVKEANDKIRWSKTTRNKWWTLYKTRIHANNLKALLFRQGFLIVPG